MNDEVLERIEIGVRQLLVNQRLMLTALQLLSETVGSNGIRLNNSLREAREATVKVLENFAED
jgi:hypothetical protein